MEQNSPEADTQEQVTAGLCECGEDSLSTDGVGTTGHPLTKERKNLEIDLAPLTIINLKCVSDINIK